MYFINLMILFKIFFAPIDTNRVTANITAEDVCVIVVKNKKKTTVDIEIM